MWTTSSVKSSPSALSASATASISCITYSSSGPPQRREPATVLAVIVCQVEQGQTRYRIAFPGLPPLALNTAYQPVVVPVEQHKRSRRTCDGS
eukprot:6050290-Amphidinium_carterae.1